MNIAELDVLRWAHILCMVYWLGGEWAIFQTSFNIVNRHLSMEERRRHLETAYRIDILARSGILLLLPLGLHMGHIYGFQPYGGIWLVVMWCTILAWLSLTWAAFFTRETDLGISLTKIDEKLRYILIPAIFIVAISSFLGHGPLLISHGSYWYGTKLTLYAVTLIMGLGLRYIMRAWTVRFRRLEAGPNPAEEAALEREFMYGRVLAVTYWITIASICFLGATKPF
jgi:hypothetical protein